MKVSDIGTYVHHVSSDFLEILGMDYFLFFFNENCTL